MEKENKKKEKEQNQNKNILIMIIVFVIALVLLVVGLSYAIFTYSKNGDVVNKLSTGTVTMTYTEGNNKISITDAMPIEDAVGKRLADTNQVFDFTLDITINGKMAIDYEITGEKDPSSTLNNNAVRLYLERSTDGTSYTSVLEPTNYQELAADDTFGAKKGEMILDTGTVQTTTKYYYKLRMWIDKNYEVDGTSRNFTVRVNAYGKDGTYINN